MDKLTLVRLALVFAAVAVWGVGYALGSDTVRLVGMALMVFALVLRFARKRRNSADPPAS